MNHSFHTSVLLGIHTWFKEVESIKYFKMLSMYEVKPLWGFIYFFNMEL